MNAKLFFIMLFVVGGLIVFGLTTKSNETTPVGATKPQIQGESTAVRDDSSSFQSQSKTMGAVDVKITPLQLEPGQEAIFEIVLNTHSVDLGYEYTKIITLIDNLDKTYRANEWIGESSGHHLTGKLIFEALSNDLRTVTLNIEGIDDQTAEFVWNLN